MQSSIGMQISNSVYQIFMVQNVLALNILFIPFLLYGEGVVRKIFQRILLFSILSTELHEEKWMLVSHEF